MKLDHLFIFFKKIHIWVCTRGIADLVVGTRVQVIGANEATHGCRSGRFLLVVSVSSPGPRGPCSPAGVLLTNHEHLLHFPDKGLRVVCHSPPANNCSIKLWSSPTAGLNRQKDGAFDSYISFPFPRTDCR